MGTSGDGPARRAGQLNVVTVPTRLAARQIAALRGKPKASFLLAVDGIRRRGCAAAGVRLTGSGLSAVCRLDLYGTWRLLTIFESSERCILLMVAEHTRAENPYRLIYQALGMSEPSEPRTKPACCGSEGQPPVDAGLAAMLEGGTGQEPGHPVPVREGTAGTHQGWRGSVASGRSSPGHPTRRAGTHDRRVP